MPKVSSYALIAAADIAPSVDSLYIVDASATGSAASREVTALELFRANLTGTVSTLGNFALDGGGVRNISLQNCLTVRLQGQSAVIQGALTLVTTLGQGDLIPIGSPLVASSTDGDADFGRTSEPYVAVSAETIVAGRTLNDSDFGRTLYYTGTANITLTVPSGLASGFRVRVVQGNSGKVTFAGSGVTMSGKQGQLSTGGQWHVIEALQLTSSQYIVHGDTAN